MTIPTGYGQAQVRFAGNGVPLGAAVTFGYIASITALDPLEQAEAIHTNFVESILTVMSLQVSLQSVLVKLGPADVGPSAEYVSAVPGSVNDNVVAPNTAMLATKRTALGGRKHRGRFYVPGIGEASTNSSGIIVGDLTTDWPAACTSFLGKMNADDLGMFVLHGDATDPTQVTSLEGQLTLATQRRRLRR